MASGQQIAAYWRDVTRSHAMNVRNLLLCSLLLVGLSPTRLSADEAGWARMREWRKNMNRLVPWKPSR
jgi:hypothetical protein